MTRPNPPMGKISFGMEIEMLALFFFSAYVAVRGDSRYVKSCWRVQEGQFLSGQREVLAGGI